MYNALPLFFSLFFFTNVVSAFGAGFVTRGSPQQGTSFRHGDILISVPFLALANRRLLKSVYFGNWLRDFSQILDTRSLTLVPEPILRVLVRVFAVLQFGYSTGEFEVTAQRLGFYRPREHIDNPRGYDGGNGAVGGLHWPVLPEEYAIDCESGMKNYVANTPPRRAGANGDDNARAPRIETAAEYIEDQLIAAVACGRSGDLEAHLHLGAALHAIEDFVAHSNWLELSLRKLGEPEPVNVDEAAVSKDASSKAPGLAKVFPFVGDAVTVETKSGLAPPLVTGTFGALDLYETLLGEIDDKLSAFSIPALRARTSSPSDGVFSTIAKALLNTLKDLDAPFERDVASIQKLARNPLPADWGKLQDAPDLLWDSIEPFFRLRDKIIRWVYDHLTIRAVQDALAAVSTFLDRLVYTALGIFLRPVLDQISGALQEQEAELLAQERAMRDTTVFELGSTAQDPSHSELAKDHYGHPLNELAGRVATVMTTFTIAKIAPLWHPESTEHVQPVLEEILSALHHPYNVFPGTCTEIQAAMYGEVKTYVSNHMRDDPVQFEATLASLDRKHSAARRDAHAAGHHTNTTHNNNDNDEDDEASPIPPALAARIALNLQRACENGHIPAEALVGIEKLLRATPSDEAPNPLDAAMTGLGGLGLRAAFEDVGTDEMAGVPGIGEVLRDAIITIRLMELEEEQGDAGLMREDVNAEWSPERCREMCALMDVEKNKKEVDKRREMERKRAEAENGTAKESKAAQMKDAAVDRMKDGLTKLKFKK